MSKAKWVWLASLLLAAYALAYVSWIPPHAVLTQAYPMNATHFTAYVNNTTVYIAQAGSPSTALQPRRRRSCSTSTPSAGTWP
jgi:hypothetical protein